MKQSQRRENLQKKKFYVKPEAKKVTLNPEEAVLGFCKTSGKYGPVASNCQVGTSCYGLGS